MEINTKIIHVTKRKEVLASVKEEESKMEAEFSTLLTQARNAIKCGDNTCAEQRVLEAMAATDTEKERYISSQSSENIETTLASRYKKIYDLLVKINQDTEALRCLYKAMLFDPYWSSDKYRGRIKAAWKIIYQTEGLDKSMELLSDIKRLGTLADSLEKWSVALQIYEDIIEFYRTVESQETGALGAYGLKTKDSDTQVVGVEQLLKEKEVAEAIASFARCHYKLGMHGEVQRLCCLILNDACDYDDSASLELWARSLYETNNIEFAFENCTLALKYCKNEENMTRLKDLLSEIEAKLNTVHQGQFSPLQYRDKPTDCSIAISKTNKRSSTVMKWSEKRVKKRRNAKVSHFEKRISQQSENNSLRLPTENHCNSDTSSGTTELIENTIQRLGSEEWVNQRKTQSSTPCTATRETSGYGSYLSDTESDEMTTTEAGVQDKNLASNIFEDNEQDETPFYAQSCNMHEDDFSSLSDFDKDQKLLHTGIQLSPEFLHRFDDTHTSTGIREFYTKFFEKSELLEKLRQDPKKFVRCVIELKQSHEAVCVPVNSKEDASTIEICGRQKIGQGFNEDEVVVEILNGDAEGKTFCKVIGIWKRRHFKNVNHPVFMCTLDVEDGIHARPLNKTIPKFTLSKREIARKYNKKISRRNKVEIYDYNETEGRLCNVRLEEINPDEQNTRVCLVAFINWTRHNVYPLGVIIKTYPIGESISSGLNLLNLLHNVPKYYRKETVNQVEGMLKHNDEPPSFLLQDRKDLTELNTFTIDPNGSLDHDDALSYEKIETGYKVGVHIADVSAYIEKDSPLDREAKQRGTTFYSAIQKPRTMLPEPLSNNLFSLTPNKIRLTISLFFYIDHNGRPLQMVGNNYEIVKSFIRSKRHLTYEEAQTFITTDQVNDTIATDVKSLFKVAHMVRKNRLGNAMYATELDWEESQNDSIEEVEEATREAHYLVEEFNLMANKKVAQILPRSCKSCIPLRCHPPPSKDQLDNSVKKYGNYINIPLRLQDKRIGSNVVSFHNCVGSRSPVLIPERVWEQITSLNPNAGRYVSTDDLYPIQFSLYRQWISIQKRASYRSSGSLLNKTDAVHYSLDTYGYVHFTSPIRRYSDLVVHRLVHATVFDRTASPYTQDEIKDICDHLNSVKKQVNAFEKDCTILSQSFDLKIKPRIVNCCITDVTERGIEISSDSPNMDMTLPFNLLQIWKKSDVFKDSVSKLSKVDVTWKRRLYDFTADQADQPGRDVELKLNPYKGFVSVTLDDWAKTLSCVVEDRNKNIRMCVKKCEHLKTNQTGMHDDVSTEYKDMSHLRTCTKFSMMFSQGQQIQLQMSTGLEHGKIVPKPILLNMTDNVKLCLQHQENPVLHLSNYATRSTIDQYKNTTSYVERWLPIILMESATNTITNGNEICINNVKIKNLGDRNGSFSLSLGGCIVRSIVFSGGEEVTSYGQKMLSSYDWLCLKTVLRDETTKTNIRPHLGNIWIGHAVVTDVMKDKRNGSITVSFNLHKKAPDLPPQSLANDRFGVEVLPKSLSDRLCEGFIKTLPRVPDILAAKIALNQPIPDLDRSHKYIASVIDHDVCGTYKRGPNIFSANNKKQQEAIDIALVSRFSLIQGPPGTGKTYTAIKLVYLFNKINDIFHKEGNERKRVMLCGPSNKSVDLVAEWMHGKMGDFCPRFVRVYSQAIEAVDFPIPGLLVNNEKNKTPTSIHHVALHHVIRQKGKPFAEKIKEFDELFRKLHYKPMQDETFKDFHTKGFDYSQQVKHYKHRHNKTFEDFQSKVLDYIQLLKKASAQEIQENDVILCTTVVGSNTSIIDSKSVQQIIIDEAGMCSEPQSLVPIIASEAEQVVLIGDHKQLRPIILCKEAASLGLEKSLFERYAKTKCVNNVKLTMLEEQYRMSPQLCRFPSEQFYNGSLVTMPGRWFNSSCNLWPKSAKTSYPFVFVHVEGVEKTLLISTEDGRQQSKSNEAEIEHVMKVYYYITKVQPRASVRILTQYSAQCSEIKRRLRNSQISDGNVSTVVSSQGGEWDYVIFSTVRSIPSYRIEGSPTTGWCRQNLGFITDQNQINVSLTRARTGLIIIGNRHLLSCDKVWRSLLDFYEERDCVKHIEEYPPRVGFKRFPNVSKTLKQNVAQTECRAAMQQKENIVNAQDGEGWQMVQRKKRR